MKNNRLIVVVFILSILVFLALGLLASFILSNYNFITSENESIREHCHKLEKINNFWKTLNNPSDIPELPEQKLAFIIYEFLVPMTTPGSSDRSSEQKKVLGNILSKGGLLATDEDNDYISKTLMLSNNRQERLGVLKKLLIFDRHILNFLEERFSDQERMGAFLKGKRVSLHPIPSHCKNFN